MTHRRTPQIQIAISQPQVFVAQSCVQLERQRRATVQNSQFCSAYFDFAGCYFWIGRTRQSLYYQARNLNYLLIVQSVRFFGDVGELIRTKNNLGTAFAIPEIDENDTTMIASGSDPHNQGDLLSNLFGAKFVTMMCAIHSLGRHDLSKFTNASFDTVVSSRCCKFFNLT